MRPQDMEKFSADRMRAQAMARMGGLAPKVPTPAATGRRAPSAPVAPVQKHAAPEHAITGFLRSLDEVRRGIILSEVLSPPVSLREP